VGRARCSCAVHTIAGTTQPLLVVNGILVGNDNVTSLTQSAETVIQVEYNIDKNVSIVAVRDQNGVLGFDVHIRRRKK